MLASMDRAAKLRPGLVAEWVANYAELERGHRKLRLG